MADTGWLNPTNTGDSLNDWTNPTNAYSSDDSYATCELGAPTYTGSQDYNEYGISLSDKTIDGIEVGIEASADDNGNGSQTATVYLWNESSSGWSNFDACTLSTSEATYTLGGSTDKWGKTWTTTDLNNTNFIVWVVATSSNEINTDTFFFDNVKVKIYYTDNTSTSTSTTTSTSTSTSTTSTSSSTSTSTSTSTTSTSTSTSTSTTSTSTSTSTSTTTTSTSTTTTSTSTTTTSTSTTSTTTTSTSTTMEWEFVVEENTNKKLIVEDYDTNIDVDLVGKQ